MTWEVAALAAVALAPALLFLTFLVVAALVVTGLSEAS